VTQLHGVVPPGCTPLTRERELDVPSLERLAAFLEVVAGVATGQVPVLAGIIDTTTTRVIEHPKAFAALKDSSGDLDGLRTVLDGTADLVCLSGSETLADLGLFIGAHGLVPGIGNVDPHGYLRLYDAVRRGDWAAPKTGQARPRGLFEIIHVGDGRMGRYSSAMGAFKEGLVARGVITGGTTSAPMIPSNVAERTTVRRHLADAGLL
jgi:4-hydroxy-tetrahydrodipicolinate synthase